jgi:hypothetical protein
VKLATYQDGAALTAGAIVDDVVSLHHAKRCRGRGLNAPTPRASCPLMSTPTSWPAISTPSRRGRLAPSCGVHRRRQLQRVTDIALRAWLTR